MKNTFKKVFIGFMAFAMATGSFAQQRAHKKDNESYPKEWKQIARMEQDSFFLTDEARRIAENVLAFQRCTPVVRPSVSTRMIASWEKS